MKLSNYVLKIIIKTIFKLLKKKKNLKFKLLLSVNVFLKTVLYIHFKIYIVSLKIFPRSLTLDFKFQSLILTHRKSI